MRTLKQINKNRHIWPFQGLGLKPQTPNSPLKTNVVSCRPRSRNLTECLLIALYARSCCMDRGRGPKWPHQDHAAEEVSYFIQWSGSSLHRQGSLWIGLTRLPVMQWLQLQTLDDSACACACTAQQHQAAVLLRALSVSSVLGSYAVRSHLRKHNQPQA